MKPLHQMHPDEITDLTYQPIFDVRGFLVTLRSTHWIGWIRRQYRVEDGDRPTPETQHVTEAVEQAKALLGELEGGKP